MQKNVSYGGLGCALGIIFLTMSAYLPTLKAATLFLSSALVYVMLFKIGFKWTFVMYAATAILAFFVCQSASPAITASYIICFGNYPVVKVWLDRRKTVINYGAKLVFYTLYFFAVYYVFVNVLSLPVDYSVVLLYGLGLVVFYFYDYLLLSTGRYLMNLLNK